MIRYIHIILIILLTSSSLLAQNNFTLQLAKVDLLENDTVFAFGTDWRYRPGDSLIWASPDYNDSKWDTLNIAFTEQDLTSTPWTGIGWFRKKIHTDTILDIRPFTFDFYGIGAFEIFLDGELIHKEGKVGSSAENEAVAFRTKFNKLILNFQFDNHDNHVLAVRMSNHHALETDYLEHGGWIGMVPLLYIKNSLDHQYQILRYNKKVANNIHFFIGFIAVMFILHLIIFIFNPSVRDNLYFILFIILLSTTPILSLYLNELSAIEEYFFYHSLYIMNNLVMGVMLLRFMYSVFYKKVPLILWLLSGAILLYVPVSFVLFGNLINATNARFTHFFYAILAVEMTRLIIVSIRKRKKNSWIIGIGGLLCVAIIFYVIACDILFKTYIMEYSEYLGFLFYLISMSFYLALEFVNSQKTRHLAIVSAQAKGQFLAKMSHELRTPMNAIIGFTDLSLNTHLDKKQRGYLKKIDYSAKSLLGIINDILDYSKLEARKLSLEEREFDLEELINSILNSFNYQSAIKGNELICDLEKDVPFSLQGDSMRLEQILNNLCGNAVKFTDNGMVLVRVSMMESNDTSVMLQFDIQDTGIGMTNNQLEHVFEYFTQAETDTTRKYGGTGLGLAITRELVQLMGGELHVESEVGKGTKVSFKIWFPLAASNRRDKLTFEYCPENTHILICDANETRSNILKRSLLEFQIKDIEICQGDKFEEKLKGISTVQHLIILADAEMPNFDINNINKITNKLPDSARMDIIAIRPNIRSDFDVSVSACCSAVLEQPVLPTSLFNSIHEILFKKESKEPFVERNTLKGAKKQFVGRGSILLVEDNETNQQMAFELLKLSGFDVDVASNGREAIHKVKTSGSPSKYDLILMDIHMPETDGIEATRKIKQMNAYSELPVVAMTADVFNTVRQKCMNVGIVDFIYKPIDPKKVIEVVKKWVVQKQSDAKIKRKSEHDPLLFEMPEIAGVDTDMGLMRIGFNQKLYLNILKGFHRKQKHIVFDIPKAIRENDYELAYMLTHTLKSASGNIGAEGVFKAAQRLEIDIKERRIDHIYAASDELIRETTVVIDSLHKLFSHIIIEDKPQVNTEILQRYIRDLEKCLMQSDPEAIDYLLKIGEIVDENEMFRKLETHVSEFNFEKSLLILDEFKKYYHF